MDGVIRSKQGLTLIYDGVKVFIPRAFVTDALEAIAAEKEDEDERNQT